MTAHTDRHFSFLSDLFPDGDCLIQPEELLVFGTDASRLEGTPLAVVRPRNRSQIEELLRYAQTERIPLYPRARATNVVGACVPADPRSKDAAPRGIVVSTLLMDKVLEVSADDFVAVVQPGVITRNLQQRVEAQNLFYPPDPASLNISTIGGNVATCAGGMCALKYGVTREYVLGMEAVLPGGKVLRTGGRCHKNVVGLDLVRLMTGSEGTLGIMSEITLKLLPKPEANASVLAGFADMERATAAIRSVFRAGMLPAALEFMGPETLDCLSLLQTPPWPDNVRAALLFRLDGSTEMLQAERAKLEKALCADSGHAPIWQAGGSGSKEEEPLWEMRRSINPASYLVAPDKISDDVTVPRGALLTALTRIRAVGRQRGLTILTFGHVGDGNIHVNIMHDKSQEGVRENALAAKKEVMQIVLSLGGTLSGEHGVGLTKAPYVDSQLSSVERELMRGIKQTFDPADIMNPGKAY
ncbi:FAD-binding oxidoreductase [Oleidesulfovibrio sp.]|uniref:FAD-binding oxidoreductase n=1 Tax=Oleidesulfovibrio sp. TaxID=2909707 RepID=UPI003A891BAA